MRFLAWNILHGGGPRRTPEIVLALLEEQPDVIALTEARRAHAGQMLGVLADHGWVHARASLPEDGSNGTVIASRWPLEPGAPPPTGVSPGRWLDARVAGPGEAFAVTAVHVPDARRSDLQRLDDRSRYLRALVDLARARSRGPHAIMGDFNAGRHRVDEPGSAFTCTALLGAIATQGYADAYRLCEPGGRAITWQSHTGAGFRLDAVWVSPSWAGRVVACRHGDAARRRGVSDHAFVSVDLRPPPERARPGRRGPGSVSQKCPRNGPPDGPGIGPRDARVAKTSGKTGAKGLRTR